VFFSPFHFYYGLCPPYIYRRHVWLLPPPVVYIEVPVYVGSTWHGYRDGDDYYLDDGYLDTRWKNDEDLRRSVYDMEDAWRADDINALSALTDPNVKVGIFAKGHYEYSLDASDYLDMTRDFMATVRTTGFDVYRVHYKRDGVYQLFARHTYESREGQTRVVYLCMVVERISGRWTLTQVDTSPDRIQD